MFITLFPREPGKPTSILGFSYFNEREIQILVRRVLLDDPTKLHVKPNVSGAEIKKVVRQGCADVGDL